MCDLVNEPGLPHAGFPHEGAALADTKVRAHTAGKMIRRVIVVPGKLVNIVTS